MKKSAKEEWPEWWAGKVQAPTEDRVDFYDGVLNVAFVDNDVWVKWYEPAFKQFILDLESIRRFYAACLDDPSNQGKIKQWKERNDAIWQRYPKLIPLLYGYNGAKSGQFLTFCLPGIETASNEMREHLFHLLKVLTRWKQKIPGPEKTLTSDERDRLMEYVVAKRGVLKKFWPTYKKYEANDGLAAWPKAVKACNPSFAKWETAAMKKILTETRVKQLNPGRLAAMLGTAFSERTFKKAVSDGTIAKWASII